MLVDYIAQIVFFSYKTISNGLRSAVATFYNPLVAIVCPTIVAMALPEVVWISGVPSMNVVKIIVRIPIHD